MLEFNRNTTHMQGGGGGGALALNPGVNAGNLIRSVPLSKPIRASEVTSEHHFCIMPFTALCSMTQDCPLDKTEVSSVVVAPEGVPLLPGLLSPKRLRPTNRIFHQEGEEAPGLDHMGQDLFTMHPHGCAARMHTSIHG